MSEGLRAKISDELKAAMKAGDKLKVSTLRLVGAAIKDRDIQNRTAGPDSGVSDAQIVEVLAKMVKQRQESVAIYQQGGRPELAKQESDEIDIIQSFMPKQLSEAEVRSVIAAIIKETGAQSVKDMGKVMAALKAKYAGQMDMAKAGGAVKSQLGG
ncbi:MAG: GatB/YqeY domain-containing protein [Rhizobiales bacterium]|nr:GatB/YqeY domain-containing protein [Hyphomicrobiales bacterium]